LLTIVQALLSAPVVDVPPPHVLFEHVWPLLHVPQVSVPPQPSEMLPQFLA
jgi:hypothetical protein